MKHFYFKKKSDSPLWIEWKCRYRNPEFPDWLYGTPNLVDFYFEVDAVWFLHFPVWVGLLLVSTFGNYYFYYYPMFPTLVPARTYLKLD